MSDVTAPEPIPVDRATTTTTALAVAGLASIGAGAIHAAALGAHSESRQTAITFALLAVAQIGWGVLALSRPNRLLVSLGALMNAGAIGGFLAAKTTGISFIDGLETSESVQVPDAMAAGFAAVAVLAAVQHLITRRPATERLVSRHALGVGAIVMALVALPAMTETGGHSHAGAAGDDHTAMAGHNADGSHTAGATDDHGDDGTHTQVVLPARAYDPNLPIDMGGVDGVTPEQQARAENLIAASLADLPQWNNPDDANTDGFFSIGDSVTGYEHYISTTNMRDEHILDPDFPESLVYQNDDTSPYGKKLVAAMYMLNSGDTLDDVPDVGGPLTQWHVHNNLCFGGQPARVVGLTNAAGECAFGIKGAETPMLHVWLIPHECGPFAALEGVGGGQIPEGETRLCDTAHGH